MLTRVIPIKASARRPWVISQSSRRFPVAPVPLCGPCSSQQNNPDRQGRPLPPQQRKPGNSSLRREFQFQGLPVGMWKVGLDKRLRCVALHNSSQLVPVCFRIKFLCNQQSHHIAVAVLPQYCVLRIATKMGPPFAFVCGLANANRHPRHPPAS